MFGKKKRQMEMAAFEAAMIDGLCKVMVEFFALEKKKVELKCVEAVKGKKEDEKIHCDPR